ncbi:ribonuclease HII [Anaplasma platys]|uniref:Ribonuclease HII n=1 Tax=Anaplasma platys TaxID=949 RepID=A0A858PYU2_9RICK|nr:ribonuclease HII [Anaplasma platys]QJC27786.1 ribonuclease HII [Anaplasma platys]
MPLFINPILLPLLQCPHNIRRLKFASELLLRHHLIEKPGWIVRTSFFLEDAHCKTDNAVVVGVDEVGYGALAGPVFAAAVYIPHATRELMTDIKDSKALSIKKREELFDLLAEYSVFNIGHASVSEIEQHNILVASHMAMKRALAGLTLPHVDLVLIDGIRNVDLSWPSQTITKGDSLCTSIAAASIIAKVSRDRLMKELHQHHPEYAWNKNHGYGTKAHIDATILHGITPHHRRTFAPVQKLVTS